MQKTQSTGETHSENVGETASLARFYKNGHLKRGCSVRADEAIAQVLDCLGDFSGFKFEEVWQKFVVVVLAELPNISPYNLVSIDSGLIAYGRFQESLFLHRVVIEIIPDSWEQRGHLGHAYQRVGNFPEAAEQYARAYAIARSHAERQDSPTHPLWLDAADFCLHLADMEQRTGLLQDALVDANRALTISEKAHGGGPLSKRGLKLLVLICLAMDMPQVAAEFQKRLGAREKVRV